jgi:hypothetical protein
MFRLIVNVVFRNREFHVIVSKMFQKEHSYLRDPLRTQMGSTGN